MLEAQILPQSYGRDSLDRRVEAREPTPDGARAALECFYFAFNRRSADAVAAAWAQGPLISLSNPLGGVMRGLDDIRTLYQRIFSGPARVWVEFYDVVEYAGHDTVVFAGRERGKFTRDGRTVPLTIRTTRVFQYFGAQAGWRQVHHHGSIDDPEALARYQRAVRET
jgi:ketosteroid isomerase-like protein